MSTVYRIKVTTTFVSLIPPKLQHALACKDSGNVAGGTMVSHERLVWEDSIKQKASEMSLPMAYPDLSSPVEVEFSELELVEKEATK